MAKFKVGDKVRVKVYSVRPLSWNWNGRMDKWMGKIVTIKRYRSDENDYIIEEDSEWYFEESDFDPIEQPRREFIVLRRDGAKTIAELRHDREVIKSAVATCSEKDTFDFETGAKIAFDRLMGREADEAMPRCKMPEPAPQPAHRFKVGDRVLVEEYKEIGEISAIDPNDNSVPYLVFHASGCHSGGCHAEPSKPEHAEKCSWFSENRLSPAPAPEPPKFYTGKVFAEKSSDPLFKSRDGKVFKFVDGQCVNAIFKDSMNGEIRNINHLREMKSCTTWHEVKSDV